MKRCDRDQVEFALFLKQYGRKRRPGGQDPNDRSYSKKVAGRVKRMDPVTFDQLLRGDDSPDEQE